MRLSFVPLDGALVPVPGDLTLDGQPPRRVCARVRKNAWETISTPLAVDDTDKTALGLIRMAQRGDLAPADAETAAAVGVPFRAVTFVGPTEGWRVTAPTRITPSRKAQE